MNKEPKRADVELHHRAPAGSVTQVGVHWTPNGFILQVRAVQEQPGGSALEDDRAVQVKLPYTTRRKRVSL